MTPHETPRFEVLDGLRGVAAIAVVILHGLVPSGLNEKFIPHAHLAVDFFFALSGFVISFAYSSRLEGGMGAGEFMLRRLIRLYPMILVGLALGSSVLIARFFIQHTPDLIAPTLKSVALNLFSIPSPYLSGREIGAWPANPPQWSLSFELIASVAFGGVLWRLGAGALFLLACGSAFCVVLLSLHNGGVYGGEGLKDWTFGLVRVTYPFVTGILVQKLWSILRLKQIPSTGMALFFGALLISAFSIPTANEDRWAYESFSVILLTPAIIFICASLSISGKTLLIARWLGDISYPLYIIHFPIVRAVFGYGRTKFEMSNTQQVFMTGVVLVVSCLVAHVLLRKYDGPTRNWLSKYLVPRTGSTKSNANQLI